MTKRGAETSGEKDAGRLAVCVICVTYTVDRPVPRCETHNRHPTDCIRALQSELAAAKAKHDEELAARRRRSDLALGIVQKERDAALARGEELEYWRNGSWAMKALDKARSEAEALRAGIVLAIREIKGRYDTEDDAPMWVSAVVNDLARLSPPAPAPKPHPWSAAGLALRDKPAPETAKCPECGRGAHHKCSIQPDMDFPCCCKHSATVKVAESGAVGENSGSGVSKPYGVGETGVAARSIRAPSVPAAPPAKPAAASAPCEHSWVEEENEADQRQMACENCGAVKPAPAPECDHAASFGVFVGGKLLCRVCDMPAPAPAPKCAKHDTHHFGSDDGGKTVERYGAIPGTNGREPCQDGSAFAKPAPETAKCPNLPGHETHSPPCGFDYSILDPKHSATAKAVVGKESKMGLEATAPLEAPTQPPAAENAPCPDHRPELQWVCETCGERTAPV